MVANVNKLKGKIVENGYSVQKFIEAMGMTRMTFYNKLNSEKYEFSISESVRAKELLKLTTDEYLEIFINF